MVKLIKSEYRKGNEYKYHKATLDVDGEQINVAFFLPDKEIVIHRWYELTSHELSEIKHFANTVFA